MTASQERSSHNDIWLRVQKAEESFRLVFPHHGWMYHFRQNGSLCAIRTTAPKMAAHYLKDIWSSLFKLHKVWQLVRAGIRFHWKRQMDNFQLLNPLWAINQFTVRRKRTISWSEQLSTGEELWSEDHQSNPKQHSRYRPCSVEPALACPMQCLSCYM